MTEKISSVRGTHDFLLGSGYSIQHGERKNKHKNKDDREDKPNAWKNIRLSVHFATSSFFISRLRQSRLHFDDSETQTRFQLIFMLSIISGAIQGASVEVNNCLLGLKVRTLRDRMRMGSPVCGLRAFLAFLFFK